MQIKLWTYFLLPKTPIFSNLARGNRKEWNLDRSNEPQISQILGIKKIYMPIEGVKLKK
jgi:hypothetical protein